MVQQFYLWVYIQKNWKQWLRYLCANFNNINFSKWEKIKFPSTDKNFHQLTNGSTKYDVEIQGKLFRPWKNENSEAYYSMDQLWRHYTKWNKQIQRDK
jgi:hypothetical protein